MMPLGFSPRWLGVLWLVCLTVGACSGPTDLARTQSGAASVEAPLYRIGPNDTLEIVVWRQPDLQTSVTVRPDGRITVPLIDDLRAADKTPTELAKDLEEELSAFVRDPLVTVIVTGFSGTFQQQVRVVGAAVNPAAIPYRANMTLLDAMIAVGGLAETAAGDRATLVRVVDGEQKSFRVRLDDLLRDGRISANVSMLPGDILIIPERLF
ncbi:XrtA/PEP-CTERM system exopolysaccharide export protein [Rhodothalassium salexigens]|uniref:XrtA/PEP-CTERM system exopolysaccharide export protein n=1 Tax=Rhodothalassium salexigens TaxID=1086 RepID=UPI003D34C9A2